MKPRETVYTIITVAIVIVLASFLSQKAGDEQEAQHLYEGACAQAGGKVYYIDSDHKVCVRNGKVVEIRGN